MKNIIKMFENAGCTIGVSEDGYFAEYNGQAIQLEFSNGKIDAETANKIVAIIETYKPTQDTFFVRQMANFEDAFCVYRWGYNLDASLLDLTMYSQRFAVAFDICNNDEFKRKYQTTRCYFDDDLCEIIWNASKK